MYAFQCCSDMPDNSSSSPPPALCSAAGSMAFGRHSRQPCLPEAEDEAEPARPNSMRPQRKGIGHPSDLSLESANAQHIRRKRTNGFVFEEQSPKKNPSFCRNSRAAILDDLEDVTISDVLRLKKAMLMNGHAQMSRVQRTVVPRFQSSKLQTTKCQTEGNL
mmetsp:Transcript_85373/g.147585  ORF Transcript_85373/g.147585 Transcript_85373/m.147585 type:complete len:162 (+) Transcript_85373:56-541(+)